VVGAERVTPCFNFFCRNRVNLPRDSSPFFRLGSFLKNILTGFCPFLVIQRGQVVKSSIFRTAFLGEGMEVDIFRFYIDTHAHSSHLEDVLFYCLLDYALS
jgi:hypothetical protein